MLTLRLAFLAVLPFLTVAVSEEQGSPTLDTRAQPTCTTSVVSPPPKGLLCGVAGTVSKPAPIKTTQKVTQQQCRDACLGNPSQCVSFSYNSNAARCVTYSKTPADMQFKRANSPTVFWHKGCYKTVCGLCPANSPNKCSGQCVNLSTDVNNCGSCQTQCANGASCNRGSCVCPAGSPDQCSGQCVDFSTDSNNCGSCQNQCASGTICDRGSCVCSSDSLTFCSNTCVDLSSSNDHCGSCQTSCASPETCSGGRCLCPSGSPSAGLPSCNGSCNIFYNLDRDNCGGCGRKCGANANCQSSQCVCPAGQGICTADGTGDCQDLTRDPQNCGQCGVACGDDQTCIAGKCSAPVPYLHASRPDNATLDGLHLLTDTGHVARFVANDVEDGGYKYPFVFNSTTRQPQFLVNNDPNNYLVFDSYNYQGSALMSNTNPKSQAPSSPPTCSLSSVSSGVDELFCSVTFGGTTYSRWAVNTNFGQGFYLLSLVGSSTDESKVIRLLSYTDATA